MKKLIAAVAVAGILVTGCAVDSTRSYSGSQAGTSEDAIFDVLLRGMIDDELCLYYAILGPTDALKEFRVGFVSSGEPWRSSYNTVFHTAFREEC